VILCLYAVVATTPAKMRIAGMRNESMTVVRAGRISGVVGRLASVPRPSPANLRAYHQAMGRLFDVVPALLPVRFGTTLHSEAEVVMLLRARSASFRTALTRVRRRAQMTVRFVRRDDPHANNERATPAVSRSSGTAYLHSRAGVARRLAGWEPCAELRRVAKRWIKAEVIEERNGVVSVYHLVSRADAASYRRAVEAATLAPQPRVTGPFPPFAFVDPLSASLPVAVPAMPRESPRSGRGASRPALGRGAGRG
jgi:hypothetical protein